MIGGLKSCQECRLGPLLDGITKSVQDLSESDTGGLMFIRDRGIFRGRIPHLSGDFNCYMC